MISLKSQADLYEISPRSRQNRVSKSNILLSKNPYFQILLTPNRNKKSHISPRFLMKICYKEGRKRFWKIA